jgi:hypothetical protein
MSAKKPQTVISNNTFVGVQWDGKSIEAIQTVAEALLNLTKVFRSQHIEIDAMLKINNDNPLEINKQI